MTSSADLEPRKGLTQERLAHLVKNSELADFGVDQSMCKSNMSGHMFAGVSYHA